MILLIVLGKFIVWMTIVRLFRYPLVTAIAVAAGLTQIGELSFVVVQAGRSSGILGENVFCTVIAASLISILLNVFIVRGTFWWLIHRSPNHSIADATTGMVIPAVQRELFARDEVA